ncbi:MAG TPA: hypothetical protein VGN16_02760 [Acidobacteriaceae bacterium]|jgi:hypothetical protein
MKQRSLARYRKVCLIGWILLFLDAPHLLMAEPTPAAVAVFNAYSKTVEARLAQQHRTQGAFLAAPGSGNAQARLRAGELIIERLNPPAGAEASGALLHHWRGTAFAPGAKPADFERLIKDFNSYPQHFSPQVLQAGVLASTPDRMRAWMRVRQKHVITVVMDTAYDIDFGRLDVQHGYSISRSTRVAEIDAAGTNKEHALSGDEEHGFLWRLNTYWSYEERDGGLYLQIETISLTRAIPHGLGWVIRPYVESIPRESLEFTLRSACNAIRK